MSNNINVNVPYLDGWHGMAIILVLLSHFFPIPFGPFGEFGVLLFFVLSGFFMSNLLFIKKVSISSFFARRFNRIFPTLLLFISITAIYSASVQKKIYVVPIGEMIDTLFFLRTYFPSDISIWKEDWPIGHLWSLNVEEHSYIYLGIGSILFSRQKNSIFACIFLIASTLAILGFIFFYGKHQPDGATPWMLRSECASFGLIASATYRVASHHYFKDGRVESPLFPVMAFILACLCFSSLPPPDHSNAFRLAAAPLLATFAINNASNFPEIVKKILSLRVIRWFGLCSFSIYLWQQPLYQHSGFSLLRLLIAIGLGSISFYFFENPIRLFLNRRLALHEREKSTRLKLVS